MRFLRLDLIKWGHFTDLSLDFPSGDGLVHVIYGPNEAGKSTALRALRALLYGIETRSTDNFLHDYGQLRLGALLETEDGAKIEFIRRKGTKNTFLDRDGNPGDETPLQRALSGMDEKLFASLFGINHERLIAGGQSILKGGGNVGQNLFAVGLGVASVRDVLEKLDGEAMELFKAQGQNQAINRACREHTETRRLIAELSLSSREYEERAAALSEARGKQKTIAEELQKLRSETTRLERFARALPNLPVRKALLEELQQLGEVPLLPEDFTRQRVTASQVLANSREQTAACQKKITDFDQEIAGRPVAEALLAREDVITELYQRLGSHRKAARDLPALRAELRTLEKDSERLLKELKLEQPDHSRLSRTSQRKVQTLGSQYQALNTTFETATRTTQKLSRDLEARKGEWATLPEVTGLRAATGEAHRQGNLEEDLASRSDTLRLAEAFVADELKRLSLWNGTLDELAVFAGPGGETVERFEKSWAAVEKSAEQVEERLRETRSKAVQCEREMEEMLRAGPVPTEADLASARLRRDASWKAIRTAWLSEAIDPMDPKAEADTYESEIETADDLADRLRSEAARVARFAQLTAESVRLTREVADLQAALARQETTLEQLKEEWRALWPPVDPLPPREMRAWLQKQTHLLQQIADLRKQRAAEMAIEDRIAKHRAALLSHLSASSDFSLQTLVAQSQSLLEKADRLEREVTELTGALKSAVDELHEAQDSLAKWKTEWAAAMREIGRAETTPPEEANDFIGDCAELQTGLIQADRLRARIKAIQSEGELFENDATATFAQFDPVTPGLEAEAAVADLHERLNRARQNAATLATIKEQRAKTMLELESSRRATSAAELDLAGLCRQAGCAGADGLEAIERKFQEVLSKRRKLEMLDDGLRKESGGARLEVFLTELATLDGDTLAAQIAELEREIKESEDRLAAVHQVVGREESLLEKMNGNASAAEAAEKSQALLGQIEEHAEQFIRLRLASAILRREIERYRAENQNPLLSRAGDFFRELTLGSFVQITTSFDAADNPILMGVRGSSETVPVEGMSEGTRDQLFLSLQLASVEKVIASSEPMPFIVDDILIAFDHHREAAVLRVLAELARRTQVIVFSHHRHLVELARETLGQRVQIHDLESARRLAEKVTSPSSS